LKTSLAKKRLDVAARFEIVGDPLRGRRSTVYIARDRKTGEEVALKILDAKKTAEDEARFKGLNKPSEGEISSQFNHPYICKTFEYGITTDGSAYLILESLGASLRKIFEVGEKVLPGRRLKYLRQVAEALETVHQAGFIHRNISARNLLFTEDGESLKLSDFGYAVPASGRYLEPGNRTGTPEYIAPELIRLQRTDHRLDVFAFGVVAYEMFTYKHPWGQAAMGAIPHTTPPVDIRQYRPDIQPDLADIIMACIHPDMAKRCPSMSKFLTSLRRIRSETVK
jgi:serine/threonine-protein kinase